MDGTVALIFRITSGNRFIFALLLSNTKVWVNSYQFTNTTNQHILYINFNITQWPDNLHSTHQCPTESEKPLQYLVAQGCQVGGGLLSDGSDLGGWHQGEHILDGGGGVGPELIPECIIRGLHGLWQTRFSYIPHGEQSRAKKDAEEEATQGTRLAYREREGTASEYCCQLRLG